MSQRQPRTRLAPAARRALIIEDATRLISERGFNAFTMSRLAEECGLTRAGVDHHFPSKEALLIEVLRLRDDRDLEAISGSTIPRPLDRTQIWTFLDDLVERNSSQPEIVRLYTVLGAEALDPEHPVHEYFADRTLTARHAISDAVREWHPEPELFAVQVLGALDGLQLQWLRDPGLDLPMLWRSMSESLRR